MSNVTTGISYGVNGFGLVFWLKQMLNGFSPEQWTAIGVIGTLLLGFLTFAFNVYFKIKERREKRRTND